MNKSLDFYFDFISPYSYLAYKKLLKLNKNNDLKINYKPILLGGLHKLGGIIAPAFNERKMKNMKNDCELVALKNNIEFKWNSNFPINSLYLMRGYIVIEEKFKKKYFDICFDFYWKKNKNILDEKNTDQILDIVGLDKKKYYEMIEKTDIKNNLKKLTNDVFEKNVIHKVPKYKKSQMQEGVKH